MTTQLTTLAERPARRLRPHAAPRDGLARRVGRRRRAPRDGRPSTASRTSSSTWPSRARERRSASDIAEEIEAVGGELNAATSLETTAYFARVLKGDDGVALDILADILQNPRYAEDELEREREVILQEIAATRDSPDEIAYELLQDAAFPEQAIGRPILGTAESVGSFTRRPT